MCYRRRVVSRDTSSDAAELQEQAYRKLGLAGRLRVALELSDMTHSFAIAGIKLRNAACTDQEARRILANALYGAALQR